jgi:hypothetical protein
MVEYGASTLYTLIQPACTVFVFVDRDGEGLATTVADTVDQGNVEFVGVLGEVVGAGHSLTIVRYVQQEMMKSLTSCTSSHNQNLLLLLRRIG